MMKSIKQSGFTLIEMMVGLLIGLLVTAIIVATFTQSKGSYTQDEEIARMQENGRFVLTTLAREMSMAGFLGSMQINDTILAGSVTTDSCSIGLGWSTPSSEPMKIYSASDSVIAGCITTAPNSGSSVLLVKHADGKNALGITSNLSGNRLFFATNGRGGSFSITTASAAKTAMSANPDTQYWEYEMNLYYVRDNSDGVPTLYRKQLDASSGSLVMGDEEELVSGLVQVGVLFGKDTQGYDTGLESYTTDTRDGVADSYSDSVASLSEVVSARLDVLMRSYNQDTRYTNDKTYTVGSTSVTSLLNTSYHARIFSTSVHLRNVAYRLQLDNL
jgi:prepilin-type N-terminal cleavage/methylation domain-containing protein